VLIPKGSAAKLTVSQRAGVRPTAFHARRTVSAAAHGVDRGGKTYTLCDQLRWKNRKGKGKRDAGFIGGGAAVARLLARWLAAARVSDGAGSWRWSGVTVGAAATGK